MRKLTVGAIALAASTMIGSTASHATFIVDVFGNEAGAVADLTTFNSTGKTPVATFTTERIQFASPPGDNTIGGFVNSPGCVILGGCGVLGLSAAEAALTLQNSVFRFQDPSATAPLGGTLAAVPAQNLASVAVNPGQVSIRHDDGVILDNGILANPSTAAGVVIINSGLATSVITNGPVAFTPDPKAVTLFYGEGFGLPATLQTNLVNAAPAPEPASLALLGSALVGFGVMMRRRRKTG